jgi:hypothetical protein
MIDQLTNTGFMGIALGLLALVALALFIERLLAYGREATGMEAFSRPFTEAVEALRFDEAADQRFLKANKELLTSVLRLLSRQQFFVCYFDTSPTPMPGGVLVTANRSGKQQLANWMYSVFPAGGTDPSSSLQLAVSMKPDAVFLPTDGEQQLKQIAQENGGDYTFVP